MLSGENFGRGSHLSDYQKIIDLIATNMGVSFLPQLSWYFSREKNIRLLNIKGAEFVRYINITCWLS